MALKIIEYLRPNGPKIYKINLSLIEKKTAKHPLLSPTGLMFDPLTKVKLFTEELEKQLQCSRNVHHVTHSVIESTKVLNLPHTKDVQHITPNEVWNIIKVLPRKKDPGLDHISNIALRNASKRINFHITKIFNSCLRLEYFPSP